MMLPQLRTLALGGLVAVTMSTAADATLFTIDDPGGSFDLGTGWVGQGDSEPNSTLNITWAVDSGFASESFTLTFVGQSATLDYGIAEFGDETNIGGIETDNLEITAIIDFVLPEILELMSVGVVGTINGSTSDSAVDVRVDFAASQIAFGTTGLLGLQLSPVSFTGKNQFVDIQVTFTLIQAYTVAETLAVPEPSTLALFGVGLAGLGFMMQRRRYTA